MDDGQGGIEMMSTKLLENNTFTSAYLPIHHQPIMTLNQRDSPFALANVATVRCVKAFHPHSPCLFSDRVFSASRLPYYFRPDSRIGFLRFLGTS